jgi:predicted DNA-binding transcriptional regulator YafY
VSAARWRIAYAVEQGRATQRVIWPLALGYFEMSRIVVAWCELRSDFRHFRTDRMHKAEISPTRYPGTRAKLLARWRDTIVAGGAA